MQSSSIHLRAVEHNLNIKENTTRSTIVLDSLITKIWENDIVSTEVLM